MPHASSEGQGQWYSRTLTESQARTRCRKSPVMTELCSAHSRSRGSHRISPTSGERQWSLMHPCKHKHPGWSGRGVVLSPGSARGDMAGRKDTPGLSGQVTDGKPSAGLFLRPPTGFVGIDLPRSLRVTEEGIRDQTGLIPGSALNAEHQGLRRLFQ